MDKYQFGEFIYKKRKEKGLTQDELGRKLGLTNKAISKWETGETYPEISTLEELANILGVTVDELLTQKSPEPVIKIKERKTPWILMICFLISSLVLGIVLIVFLNKKEDVTLENYQNYYCITLKESKVEDTSLDIHIQITDMNVMNSTLKLDYTIHYYYVVNGKEGIINYSNRIIEYTGEAQDFVISVTPMVDIVGEYSFVGFDVSYTVLEVKGVVKK